MRKRNKRILGNGARSLLPQVTNVFSPPPSLRTANPQGAPDVSHGLWVKVLPQGKGPPARPSTKAPPKGFAFWHPFGGLEGPPPRGLHCCPPKTADSSPRMGSPTGLDRKGAPRTEGSPTEACGRLRGPRPEAPCTSRWISPASHHDSVKTLAPGASRARHLDQVSLGQCQ